MSKIRLHGSSSGYMEIAPPAAGSSATVTLPNSAGEILLSDGSAASLTSIPAANIVGVCTSGLTKTGGFGKVVQFVQSQSSVSVETTSSSFQTFSQINVTITPTSATNLLFAQLSVPAIVYEQSGNDANSTIGLTDDNGSSYFFKNTYRFYDYGGSGGYMECPTGGHTVNTAGSTSERTYKARYRLLAGDKIVINSGNGLSILTVMEIEA